MNGQQEAASESSRLHVLVPEELILQERGSVDFHAVVVHAGVQVDASLKVRPNGSKRFAEKDHRLVAKFLHVESSFLHLGTTLLERDCTRGNVVHAL